MKRDPSLSSIDSENAVSVIHDLDAHGNKVCHVSQGNSIATALTDLAGNIHMVTSEKNNLASVRYFQRRVSSVQRAGNSSRMLDQVNDDVDEPLFEMPTASSNVSIDFANIENRVEDLKIEKNIQIEHDRVPSYQKWAFPGAEETDVRAGLSNFNKQESTQTVVANDQDV